MWEEQKSGFVYEPSSEIPYFLGQLGATNLGFFSPKLAL